MPPKDRLIETARMLFLRNGIARTGIDRLTSQADVARMTLYNNFKSKDDLILAVFEREADRRREAVMSRQDILEDSTEKVLVLFTVALEIAASKGFRGCAFINLATEAAAPDSALHRLAKRHKNWICRNVSRHLGDRTFSDPKMLSRQICILWDGGIMGAYMQQSEMPIVTARDTARALMRNARL